jgi:hypothetical protein
LSETHLTEAEIAALTELALANPDMIHFVSGVDGLVTCDGYAIEFENGRTGVLHPKTVIDILLAR